ncbi:MAG: hypothetical protein AB7H77_08375 [Bdellovibrionales bacterium]
MTDAVENYLRDGILKLRLRERIPFMQSAFEVATKNSGETRTVAMIALTILFEKFPLDPAYETFMAKGDARFTDTMTDDLALQKVCHDWKHAGETEQLNALQRIGLLCDKAYSTCHFGFETPARYILYRNPDSRKFSSYEDGGIRFNIAKPEWKNFQEVMRNMAHEKRHHHVDQIKTAYTQRRLQKGSLLFKQARRFARLVDAKGHRLYIEPHIDFNAYLLHPEERDCRVAENAGRHAARRLLNAVRPETPSSWIPTWSAFALSS